MALFSKVLIANRGEIAVRIAKACSALGIKSVGVFSDADKSALHTRVCDEAYHIGPSPASESYLRIDRLLEVARDSGCQAVHPGYGFLAENMAFAQAVIDSGLAWVGPPPSAIAIMGSKIESKRLAQAHGVPIVPGYFGDDQSLERLRQEAEAIGYPVLIKASAGGGGKGMRVVNAPEEFGASLEGARREALASFGDESVMLERYLVRPRHIEIQVMGDKHGTLIHLGERECSVQRRHQKVAEESPSLVVTPEIRAQMTEAALSLARAAGYENAGTMEFIFQDEEFFFLEMNTRLQVEHPVTEEALGIDIVQMQLHVAAGEPLALTQENVRFGAHALEVRLYAEDPERGFLPSTGPLKKLRLPHALDGVRVDAGVEQGDVVSPFYDPMIAKIISKGATRDESITRMQEALSYTEVHGVSTNLDFLRWLVAHPLFQAGDISTRFIEEQYQSGAHANVPTEAIISSAIALLTSKDHSRVPGDVWRSYPWRHLSQEMPISVISEGRTYRVRLSKSLEARSEWRVAISEATEVLFEGIVDVEGPFLEPDGDERMLSIQMAEIPSRQRVKLGKRLLSGLFSVELGGRKYWMQQAPALSTDTLKTALHLKDEDTLESPMPGKVLKVLAVPGDDVVDGQALVIIEAMKMEFTIKAPHDGKVDKVYYGVGDQVSVGDVLVKLAKHDG